MKKNAPAKSVPDYLAKLPSTSRATLEKVRKAIKAVVPDAEEVISYQIPILKHNGQGVAAFAAYKNHLSYYTMSHAVIRALKEDLKEYHVSGVTIQFPLDKPLPASLIKKLVIAKMNENELRALAKAKTKPAAKKAVKKPVKKEDDVEAFMKKLKHPMKAEMEEVRAIIKGANTKIMERIKWNAPSYYCTQDMVTFNPRVKNIHLVFHHPEIETIKSDILEGDYKGRRMTYFNSMDEIRKKKKELQKVINQLIKIIEKKK